MRFEGLTISLLSNDYLKTSVSYLTLTDYIIMFIFVKHFFKVFSIFFRSIRTYTLCLILPAKQHIRNAATSVATMVEPTGVSVIMEMIKPNTAHITAKIDEKIVTFLKL